MNQVLRTTAWMAILVLTFACEGENPDDPSLTKKSPDMERPIGTVSSVSSSGDLKASAKILRKGKSDWTAVSGTMPIYLKDKLRTDGGAVAVIQMKSGAEVALNADTAVELMSLSSMRFEKGELWMDALAPFGVETALGSVTAKTGAGGARLTTHQLVVSWIKGSALIEGNSGAVSLVGGDEATVDASGVRQSIIKEPSSLVAWTQKVKQFVSPSAHVDGELIASPYPAGLGTLTAKPPGGSKPLPFRILTEDILVRIQDNMAVTRVEQVFQNPTNQVVEAEYRFPIPENAVLTGYDMEIGGRMMKGEIVERDRGRKILKKVIDDYLYQMRDPALTEWESGTTFKTRIFPVQPKEQKRIVLTHLMPLPGAAGEYRYVLPVSLGATDSPAIQKFRIDATVASSFGTPSVSTPVYATQITPKGDAVTVGFESTAFTPRADFVMTIRTPSSLDASLVTFGGNAVPTMGLGSVAMLTNERAVMGDHQTHQTRDSVALRDLGAPVPATEDNTFLLRLSPVFESSGMAATPGADWLYLVDTSESRFGPDMEIQKRMVAAFMDTLGPEDRVKVMGFDTFPLLMDAAWSPPSPDLKQRVAAFLSRVQPGGATNLGDALMAASAEADAARPMRVLIIGDGAATLGETAPGALSDLAARQFPYPHSVSAVGIGSSVDRLLLEEVTRRTRGRYFSLSSGEDLFVAAVRIVLGLRGPVLESPALSWSGIAVRDVLPSAIPNLSSGTELLAAGRYQGTGKLTAVLSGTLNGHPWKKEWTFDVGAAGANNTFVPLVYAAKKIDALTVMDKEASRREMIALSKRYGMASRLTSFIVLENDAMYSEFNVDRSQERLAWSGDGKIDYENQNDIFEDEGALSAPSKPFSQGGGGAEGDALLGLGALGTIGHASDRGPRSASKAKRSAPSTRMPSKSQSKLESEFSAPVASAPSAEPKAESLYTPIPNAAIAAPVVDYGYGPMRDYSYRPRPVFDLSIRQLSSMPSPAALDKVRDLAAAVETAPLDRRARKRLVSALLSYALLDEADRALAEWSVLDRSNPEVHLQKGDLAKLKGDLPAALRAYSSVIDLQRENARILSALAAYFESRDQWKEAYPFRVSLAVLKPKDFAQKTELAVSALKAGRMDDAATVTGAMTELSSAGYPVLKKGVKLSGAYRDTVLSIRATQNLPLLFDSSLLSDLNSAGLKITLTWDRPSSLDLWVSTNKDKYVGGAFGKSRLRSNASGQEKVFFVIGSAEGRYRAQVLCADNNGCDGVSGRLIMESHGEHRTIPFVLSGHLGKDLAVIRIESLRKIWAVR